MNDLSIERVLPHLPTAVTWVLALAIGVQVALIARNLIPQPKSTPPPVVIESTRAPGPARSQSMDVQSILNAHLFGVPAQGDTAAGAQVVDAPKTQLNLVLSGTIAVEDPQKGIGLIGETAANAKVYSAGETIGGSGVQLHAVYADRVILSRGGQLEALYLPRQMAGNSRAPVNARLPAQPAGARVAERVRQMVNEDPGNIADILRPQAVFAGGKQRGFRVYPGRNRTQFARLGLAPGDLVMAIDGTPLDDPSRAMEIFRSIGSASEVTVTIERGGQKQDLVLDLAQLATQAEELAEQPVAEEPPPPEEPEPLPQEQ